MNLDFISLNKLKVELKRINHDELPKDCKLCTRYDQGRLTSITDIIVFEADTTEGLKTAFIEAVDDYLAHCERIGKQAQKAFSGKLMLRINPEVHAEVALATELSHAKSMNEFAEAALHKEAQAYINAQHDIRRPVK